MPTPYVKKLATKHHTSINKSEKEWSKAKQQAAKQGHAEDFAYITGIYKKMMGESAKTLSLTEFLQLTEMDSVSDMSYSDQPEDEDEYDSELDSEFSDEDVDGEEELDGEEEFDGEEGHELVDVLSPEELDDSEDEFDEEPTDEFSDEDFGEDDIERDRFGESKVDYIRELLTLNEKVKKTKKPLAKAAHAVYHRDYLRTRKKPYRKYDPRKRESSGE